MRRHRSKQEKKFVGNCHGESLSTAIHREPEKGQIIILLSVVFVILLLFVVLALDGGAIFLDWRSAQNAADASALAGAYVLARNPDWDTATMTTAITTAATARAIDNHYTAVVFYPPDPDTIHFVTGDSNVTHYFRVTVTSTVNTSFLQFISSGPIQNTVEAVAHVVPASNTPFFYGSELVALDPISCGALTVGGNLTANIVGGGIFVNSRDPNCAASGDSNPFFVYTPSLTVVGGMTNQFSPAQLVVRPGPSDSPSSESAIPYPPDDGIPGVPSCPTAAQKLGDGNIRIGGIAYDEWSAGSMNGFPGGNIYFDPGIYCITINQHGSGAVITNDQHLYNDPADSTRVLLFITGSAPCDLAVDGRATLQLKGYNAAPYAGLLFYFDPRTFSSLAEGPVIYNGTSQSSINGTVYAPTCALTLNGKGNNFYQGQVIGYDLTLAGPATLNFSFVASDNLKNDQPAQVDLNQ